MLSVSQDAIIRDRQQNRVYDWALGTPKDTSEPKDQELNYSARISLDRAQMQIDDRMVNLSPGMAVTVEIKTGSRMILSYLLSPLLRYRQEALRERMERWHSCFVLREESKPEPLPERLVVIAANNLDCDGVS